MKAERQARGWTLDQLAGAASVSRRMLINVEQGDVNPSVGTLLRLSDALGVGLPALVEPPEPAVLKVTRRGDGAVLWRGSAGGQGILVAGTAAPDVVELWDWTMTSGEEHHSEAHAPGTHELVHVLQGALTTLFILDALGFAAGSGFGWAVYILLTQHIGDRYSGLTGLSLTIPVAAATAAVVGIPQAAGHLTAPIVVAAVGLALLMPVLPLALEMIALRHMNHAAFGTLMALEPAIGVVLGLVVLQQHLSVVQTVGIMLVVVAGAAAQRGSRRPPDAAYLTPE